MHAAARHRRRTPQAAADLVIAVDIAEVGEADYSLGDLHDEWRELGLRPRGTPSSSRTTHGTIDRLRPLPRQRPARVGRPATARGRAPAPRSSTGPSARGASAARRRSARPSATAARAARALLEAHGYAKVRSFWRHGARRRAGETADETGLRAVARRRRARAARDHEPRVRRRRRLRAQERGGLDAAASSTATTSTTTSAACRRRPGLRARPPLGARTRSTSRCSRSTPTTRARASAARLLRARLRRRRRAAGRRSTSPPTTRTRSRLYERVGMTAALARRRLPEAAARLGRQWAHPDQHCRPRRPHADGPVRAASRPRAAATVFGKLEMFNPGGSVKDRIGVAMIEAAEKEGRIEPGRTTIVEATSGNTGIALAFVCAAKGYDLILTLPQGMSREREGLLRLYGAQVHITESMGGMNEAVAAARAMARDRDVFLPDQFSNPANPEVAPPHDRPGAVGGAGRQGRLPRRGRRHRRHDHRRRLVPEGAQPGHQGRRRRARDLARCSPAAAPARTRSRASARASSRRCCSATCSTRSSPSTTRTRSRPPALAARREGVLCGICCGAALWAALRDRRAAGGQGQADRGRAARQRRALRVARRSSRPSRRP